MPDNVGNFSSSVAGTPAASASATQSNGVYGTTTSDEDSAVYGSHGGAGIGVFGRGGTKGQGVFGEATGSNGVYGTTTSDKDSAVYGVHAGNGIGVFGRGGATAGQGVFGAASLSNGVYGTTTSRSDSAVYGEHGADGIGVFGRGGAALGEGVFGQATSPSAGVYGKNTQDGPGVSGESLNGFGVVGRSNSGYAMRAEGPVSQAPAAGGWIKAMIQVAGGPQPSVQRSFNSQPNVPAPTVYKLDSGLYSIDFHFDVSERYVSVTAVSIPFTKAGTSTFPENPYAPAWYPPPSANTSQTNFVVANVVFDGLTGVPDSTLGDPATRPPNKTMITVLTYQPVLLGAAGSNFITGFKLSDTTFTLAIF